MQDARLAGGAGGVGVMDGHRDAEEILCLQMLSPSLPPRFSAPGISPGCANSQISRTISVIDTRDAFLLRFGLLRLVRMIGGVFLRLTLPLMLLLVCNHAAVVWAFI